MVDERMLLLRPIGWVVEGHRGPSGPAGRDRESVMEIDQSWGEALDGIERFSHLWVLWWLDRADGSPPAQKVHPEGRPDMPLVGLFATRSPRRPNPLGLTAVRLLNRRGSRLYVEGLDAYEGTPILDIKPYLLRGDCHPEARMPEWLEQLWRLHDAEGGVKADTI